MTEDKTDQQIEQETGVDPDTGTQKNDGGQAGDGGQPATEPGLGEAPPPQAP